MTRAACPSRFSALRRASGLLAIAWLPGWAAAAPAAPVAPTSDSFVGEMLAIVLPLVFIIAGLLLLLRLLRRRYGLSGGDTPLTVVQILPVGPRERLVVVRSRAGRAFAIGVGAQSVTFVTDLEADDLAPTPETTTRTDARFNIAGDR
ncbi:flagellar biosynthetic protein FliO [Luteimonas sp. S4-F44]|uniref:flagellar biosynthetic protein FliO n=1 Tax=Luteimonas sp. S4-F44 TaxID=2925842 RepID=UPI001F52F70C|nr:flagellar biosynthetic protein FliO [Luteimonas sp. S4-F44]UNK42316.1 flagellar biosynthetic protein FliO [Luteimonas sp. S4-F44]